MRRRRKETTPISLHEKLKYIILTLVIPFVICMIFVLIILSIYAYKYSQITHNVTVGSKFGIDFKSNVDLKMYHYCVGSKEQTKLPVKEVEVAINLAESLQQTTSRKESQDTLENILNYCANLEKRMYTLAQTKDYDSRKLQLENNIYVLTKLIQDSMIDYIYYEAGYMSTVESVMTKNCIILVCLTMLIVLFTTTLVLGRAFRFTYAITDPINALIQNVKSVGKGNFAIQNVVSDSYEINNLDEGIQKMARKIDALLDSVKEEQLLQHKTELMLLQAQVSPHFLYNTMDTIIWLVECEMNEEAVQMITDLSVFFRTMLSSGDDIITLREELRHTKSYLDIQQVRYLDILAFSIDCPEELMECRLPKLSLQPLVENALYHGVKEKRGKSTICIRCEKKENSIQIVVEDDGIGMTEEELNTVKESLVRKEKRGFGLRAVQERIKLYYGEGYGIEMTSQKGSGTTVIIRIPEKNQPIS